MIERMKPLNGNNERKIPRAVYYRCEWIVRDYDRLVELADKGAETVQSEDELVFYADSFEGLIAEAVIENAVKELLAIGTALNMVPEEYRNGLLKNIKNRERYPDFASENTWKRWKKIFIEGLAKELNLY